MFSNISESVKKYIKFLFISLIVVIILELTIFNINFYRSLGNKQELINDYTISNVEKTEGGNYKVKGERVRLNLEEKDKTTYKHSIKASKDENGNYVFDNNLGNLEGIKNIYDLEYDLFENIVEIEIKDIDKKVNNVYLDIKNLDGEEKTIEVNVFYKDEGNSEYVYAGKRIVLGDIEQSKYLNLNFLGNTKDILLEAEIDEDDSIELNSVEINKKRIISFNGERVLLILIIINICYLLKFSSLYKIKFKDWKFKKIITGIIVIAYIIILVYLTIELQNSNKGITQANSLYDKLTYSLLNGRTDIDVETKQNLEKISNLENPYDYSVRDKAVYSNEISYVMDSAFYNGKSYCYFGVIPVVICNVPYYLITGKYIGIGIEIMLFSIGYIISLSVLLYKLIRKYYENISSMLYVCILNFLILASGIFILVIPAIHSIPNIAALFFISVGLNFWVSILKNNKNTIIRLIMGSFMMAFVAGCRPNLVISSLLLIPILMKKHKEIDFKKLGKRKIIYGILAIIVPYIITAIPLMYYNYVRFDSIFEFGAKYNLTTNDILHRGIKLDRIPYGLYMYLFSIPTFYNIYPFIKYTKFETNYLGFTHYQEMYGGLFITYPILIINFFYFKLKKFIKSKELKVAYWVCWIIVIIELLVNIEMAGINTRYMTDFIIFAVFATLLLIIEIEKNIKKEKRELFIKLIIIGIVISCILEIFVFQAFVYNYYDDTLFVNKLKEIFEFYI